MGVADTVGETCLLEYNGKHYTIRDVDTQSTVDTVIVAKRYD